MAGSDDTRLAPSAGALSGTIIHPSAVRSTSVSPPVFCRHDLTDTRWPRRSSRAVCMSSNRFVCGSRRTSLSSMRHHSLPSAAGLMSRNRDEYRLALSPGAGRITAKSYPSKRLSPFQVAIHIRPSRSTAICLTERCDRPSSSSYRRTPQRGVTTPAADRTTDSMVMRQKRCFMAMQI